MDGESHHAGPPISDMKIDASLPPVSLNEIPRLAERAQDIGFDGLWSSETQHDPFLPLPLVSQYTRDLQLGTAVAIAFARSPANLAYTAWDLAQASQGRFILGLGTQVRAHIERRFGMPWPDSPRGKLRELVQAIRAFWTTWQTGEALQLRGDYYRLSLMTPFFNPGPIDFPEIPIFLAGVNTGMCQLAGEVAEGFHAHPYHSPRYLEQVVRPAIQKGLSDSGRSWSDFELSTTAFVVTNPTEGEFVRSQIAFYASTPSYHPVMELHGWGQVAERLSQLARRGKWSEMAGLIDDPILQTFAVCCEPDHLPAELLKRYESLVDRLTLYRPFTGDQEDTIWQALVQGLGNQP